MTVSLCIWLLTIGLLAALLLLDLVVHRGSASNGLHGALVASMLWVTISVIFGIGLGLTEGTGASAQYFAGYVLEKSLSVDNVFVFALLFRAFAVPLNLQRRVLYYGVAGTLVLRGAFIAAGGVLIARFSWILYLFGMFLFFAGARMAKDVRPARSFEGPLLRAVQRVLPVTREFEGEHFFCRAKAHWVATPLFMALISIAIADVVFAADSIPAIFGITSSVFVVFTSNAFAVLGLRSLYFVLAEAIERFTYLAQGLGILLMLIGVKMLIAPVAHISVGVSLIVIVAVISGSIGISIRLGKSSRWDGSVETVERR